MLKMFVNSPKSSARNAAAEKAVAKSGKGGRQKIRLDNDEMIHAKFRGYHLRDGDSYCSDLAIDHLSEKNGKKT